MRLLFVGDEEEYGRATTRRENGAPFSLFFCAEAPDAARDEPDATVVPALRFLSWASRPATGMVIVSGPAEMAGECFESGCADYIREPWTESELYARVMARSGGRRELEIEGLAVDGGRLYGPAGSAPIPGTAAGLLELLLANDGRPVPRAAIAAVAGPASPRGRSVDMKMSRLRSLLRTVGAPGLADRLRCEHGEYRLYR